MVCGCCAAKLPLLGGMLGTAVGAHVQACLSVCRYVKAQCMFSRQLGYWTSQTSCKDSSYCKEACTSTAFPPLTPPIIN